MPAQYGCMPCHSLTGARWQVGGRAHTKDVPGLGRVEMGATYFHGTEGHPTWNLAMQHSLPGLQPEPKGAACICLGRGVDYTFSVASTIMLWTPMFPELNRLALLTWSL